MKKENERAFKEALDAVAGKSLLDEDGYPTQEALNVVSKWYNKSYKCERDKDWFEFIKSITSEVRSFSCFNGLLMQSGTSVTPNPILAYSV